jgi:hypothetical protein
MHRNGEDVDRQYSSKWNPTIGNLNLNQELTLTNDELESNKKPLQADQIMVFDPNFTLSNMADGFRIFAFEESLHEIATRRSKIFGAQPTLMTVFLHAHVLHAGQFEPLLEVMIKTVIDNTQQNETLSVTFDRPEIPLTFSSALLGGLLFVLQNTEECTTPYLLLLRNSGTGSGEGEMQV